MKAIVERSQRFLDRSLGVGPRLLLIAAALLLFLTQVGPLRDVFRLTQVEWISFAIGVLALLFLRAAVQGKLRDLVDVSVLFLYFTLFLVWSAPPGPGLLGLVMVAVLVGAAFVVARGQAHSEDIAEIRSAG
jgi:peptidoglycan/LPS O-acetylase OafA/YrhL